MKDVSDVHQINVNADPALAAISSVSGAIDDLRKKKNTTLTVTTIYKTVGSPSSGSTGNLTQSTTGGPSFLPPYDPLRGGYKGIIGKMRNMAGGGRSRGGRTLVGELGRELWISRDGKHQRVVGKNGMEIIRMQPGDAIVPNNITEQLIRGGMGNAAGGTYWSGSRGTGALTNALVNANGGNKSNATVKVSADTSDAEEAMEDALKELKERIDDIINDLEHEIFLL